MSRPWTLFYVWESGGAGAYLKGVPIDDCPAGDDDQMAAWRRGWREAAAEEEKTS